MNKILAVAKWEFLEKIKTKAFLISLITTPLILIGFTVGGTLLSGQETVTTKAIGFVDTSAVYFPLVRQKLENEKLSNGQPAYILINLAKRNVPLSKIKKEADESVLKKRIEGFIVVSNAGTDSIRIEFRSGTAFNLTDTRKFEKAFNEARINIELDKFRIAPDIIKKLSNEINIEHIRLNEKGEESKSNFLLIFFSSIIVIMMLMSIVISSGGMLVRSLIEEKSNKLIDILVSSCKPDELLTGKILGLGALGLAQIIIWFLVGLAVSGSAVMQTQAFENIGLILIYFLLGYIFYTAIFVGVGSVVNTEQEAQQITGYLTLVLIFPVILAFPAIQNPDTMLIKVLSYIPLTSPPVMILRLNLTSVQPVEIISTIIIMLISILLTIYLSAKIFRIGILSYGKMPTMKELVRWVKEG